MKISLLHSVAIVAAFAGMQVAVHAQAFIPTFQDVTNLGATRLVDKWTTFTIENHPGYPTLAAPTAAWPSALGPDTATARLPQFNKNPANPTDQTDFVSNFFGGGIYVSNTSTHFELSSGTALLSASAIQLQISMTTGQDSTDVIGGPLLTLQLNTGLPFTVPLLSSGLVSSAPATIFGMDTNVHLLAYQWDLSSYSGNIASFKVDWQVDAHSITEGLQLTQAAAAVPEPHAIPLIGGVGMLLLMRRRRVAAAF